MRHLKMKKILVIGPALAQWSEIHVIAESLQFLHSQYEIDFIDPLGNLVEGINQEIFFAEWHNKIKSLLYSYDAFFGFSLGGVILQQSFNLFEIENKPLI